MRRETCANCGETYEFTEEEEAEALAEVVANGWGDIPKEDLVNVCDACYDAMTTVLPPKLWGRGSPEC